MSAWMENILWLVQITHAGPAIDFTTFYFSYLFFLQLHIFLELTGRNFLQIAQRVPWWQRIERNENVKYLKEK